MKGALPPTMKEHPNGKDFMFSMFGHVRFLEEILSSLISSELFQLNGTDDGPYVIGRGLKNTTRGNILKWKGDPVLSHWNGKTCNMINGSDSTIFYRMDKPAPRLYNFAQDFCRYV